MGGSVGSYRLHYTLEKLVLLCVSAVIALPLKTVLLPLINASTRSLSSRTPWWNTKWFGEPRWGSLIYFFAIFILVYSSLFLLWGMVQEFAARRLYKSILLKKSEPSFPPIVGSLLHPYRRIKWLVTGLAKNSLKEYALYFNQRLAKYDTNYVESHWNTIKKLIFLLLLMAWTFSAYKFYLFASGIIEGDFTIQNLGRYFAVSFRIFCHVSLLAVVLGVIGYLGYRIWLHYTTFLDDLFWEALLEQHDRPEVTGLDEIRFRILRIEKMVESLVTNLQKTNTKT